MSDPGKGGLLEGGKASQRVEALPGCGKNTGDSLAGLLAVRSAAQNGPYVYPWPAHSAWWSWVQTSIAPWFLCCYSCVCLCVGIHTHTRISVYIYHTDVVYRANKACGGFFPLGQKLIWR